ncbi:MAG: hypothetical protein Q8N63_03900 [Nanoarchaeota archaeon]|nr:hypothetical protein [Nanoarchaeota archaeon]
MKKNKQKYPEAAFVPAGVLIGLGYGFLVNKIAAWTLIGLGLGFAVMAIIRLLRKKK